MIPNSFPLNCVRGIQINIKISFTQDGGAHRVHAGGSGLERGVQGVPSDFNVWTREAGHGSLAISVEGPSKAVVDFKDRKDGSCHVSYTVEEPGEYSVGIRFNDQVIERERLCLVAAWSFFCQI